MDLSTSCDNWRVKGQIVNVFGFFKCLFEHFRLVTLLHIFPLPASKSSSFDHLMTMKIVIGLEFYFDSTK